MSGVAFEIKSIPTFRELNGRFARAEKELLNARRDEMRAGGSRFVQLAREEAPRKTGKFAEGIRFRTFQEAAALGFKVTTPQPLGKFIIGGTKRHRISAKNAGALRFFWPKVGMMVMVPKGGGFKTHVSGGTLWIGKGYVMHPGTKPNKFIGRAYRRWLPGARAMLARISTRFVKAFTGGGK